MFTQFLQVNFQLFWNPAKKNLDQQHGVWIFHHQPHLNSNLSNPSQLNNLTICQCTSDLPCIWPNVPPWILHRNARTYEDHSISCWVSQHPLGYQSLVHQGSPSSTSTTTHWSIRAGELVLEHATSSEKCYLLWICFGGLLPKNTLPHKVLKDQIVSYELWLTPWVSKHMVGWSFSFNGNNNLFSNRNILVFGRYDGKDFLIFHRGPPSSAHFACHPVPPSEVSFETVWRCGGSLKNKPKKSILLGGFNPFERYARQTESISPGRDEHKKIFETTNQIYSLNKINA